MENAGLTVITDVAFEAVSDPENMKSETETTNKNLLSKPLELQEMNGKGETNVLSKQSPHSSAHDSGGEAVEKDQQDLNDIEQTTILTGEEHVPHYSQEKEPPEEVNAGKNINIEHENSSDGGKKQDTPLVAEISVVEEVLDREDLNQNKIQNTTATLRRSSRAKPPNSPAANDTPSSVGRTTRSQINPDIIAKQKSFMHKYQIAVKSSMDSYVRSAANEPDTKNEQQTSKRKWEDSSMNDALFSPHSLPVQEKKTKKSICNPSGATQIVINSPEQLDKKVVRHDAFCWVCHMDGQIIECTNCPRAYHQRCIQPQSPIPDNWLCTECASVRNAEKHCEIDSEQLLVMLNFAMERIKSVADSQPFFKPVDTQEFPHYTEYIVCPVDISQLEEKIAQKVYISTRAFLADFRWILHNCIVFNSVHSKLTSIARTLMKVCKHETAEIDTCADCYVHAHTKRETWFLEPCRRPHLLLWAKLKGFPHWPAKAMKANKEGNVDVRFFGAHDRAWVPAKDCYLYSKEMPMQLKNQRKANLAASIEEVDQHIKKLVERYGSFTYPPPRTAYDPAKEDDQLQMLIPGFKSANSFRLSCSKTSDREDIVDNESLHSDSEMVESTEIDVSAQSNAQEEDRAEDRRFLAMLELAPRSAVDATMTVNTANNSAPVSRSQSPFSNTLAETKLSELMNNLPNGTKNTNKELKASRINMQKSNGTDSSSEPFDRSATSTPNFGNNEQVNCEVNKEFLQNDLKSVGADVLEIKREPVENEENDADSEVTSFTNPMTISIDKVVGNYKPIPTPPKSRSDGSKGTPKLSAALKSIPSSKTQCVKHLTPKFSSKSVAKVTPNRPIAPKSSSHPKATVKSVINNRRQVGEEEDDLDPAMYLDPTITITLINNDEKKSGNKRENDPIDATAAMSSSDLQALNALGENVSITVVPKRKILQNTPNSIRSKENELAEQSMVIEVDPMNLQKSRILPHSAKARKSFPKSRASALPSHQQMLQKKTTSPPMVSIPSRHLGADVARTYTTPISSSSARIPSITVRPVSHLTSPQQNIVLQPGLSDSTMISALSTTTKQQMHMHGSTSSNNGTNLASMHTVGPDSGLGNGGLLLTFNRTPPIAASASSTVAISTPGVYPNKSDGGTLNSLLTAKTHQIAEMVRNTLEVLLQEMSSVGNLEASLMQSQMELEKCRTLHKQEISEMKKNFEAQLALSDSEKQKALLDLRRQLEAEKQRAIDEVKKKQWCAQCGQEAIFYCCWNTAYCDYPCQQSHWPKHMVTCANANQNAEAEVAENDETIDPADSPAKNSTLKSSVRTVGDDSPCPA